VELLGRRIADECGAALFVVPAGETSKSFERLEQLCRAAARAGLERDSVVVAVGGGVVGDLAGFCAAIFLRGVGLINVPTTLLAQVDSAIGGKTGINIPEGKNLVGAFKQPEAVYIDPELLATLPDREYRSGLAEVAKYAMANDAGLYESLSRGSEAVRARDIDMLTALVERCCAIKAEVVSGDETEEGPRSVLNYGHTFGHALETASAYQAFTHGEAISVGMMVAARIGTITGVTPAGVEEKQAALLQALALPLQAPGASATERMLEVMGRDKKARGGELRWVLLEDLGSASHGHLVPPEAVEKVVAWALQTAPS
jgi:3-dehydroquinate synthase